MKNTHKNANVKEYEYNYYVCNHTGKLKFSHPAFKDDNLTFHAKGTLREDRNKKYGIHLC